MKMTSSGAFSYCLVNQTLLFHKKKETNCRIEAAKEDIGKLVGKAPVKYYSFNTTKV